MKDLHHNNDQPTIGKSESAPPEAPVVEPRRRRLVRGAVAGAGVLFAVQAKTALGVGTCQSPSAMISGNTSPRPGTGVTCSGGRSPGFWKVPQKFNYWLPAGAQYPTFNVGVNVCSSGMQNLSNANVVTPGTLVETYFVGASVPAGTGFWSVLAFPTLYTGGQLLRHLIAAWLNAGYFTTNAEKYPLTKAQVIDMWNAVKGGGVYCPASLVGSCGTKGMNADAVIAYISGMYDLNAGVEADPDLCKV